MKKTMLILRVFLRLKATEIWGVIKEVCDMVREALTPRIDAEECLGVFVAFFTALMGLFLPPIILKIICGSPFDVTVFVWLVCFFVGALLVHWSFRFKEWLYDNWLDATMIVEREQE